MREAQKSTDRIFRACDLEAQGISRQRLSEMTKRGEIVRVNRGLYHYPDADLTENYSYVLACAHAPHGVLCLLTALRFHDLTTQNPWQVWMMIERHARTPKMEYPSLRIFRTGNELLTEGVEIHESDGIPLRVTCVARTITDCFKYRNKIGLDVAMEALTEALRYRRTNGSQIQHYARLCRVDEVMRPYLELLMR